MIWQYRYKKKIHLNFLYSCNGQISKIYKDIETNPINCNQEYLKKCIEVRNLFLKRIDEGMTSSEYYKFKRSFKELNKYTHYLIDNIITLLKQSDESLINLVTSESKNYNYKCTIDYYRQNLKKKDKQFSQELSFMILNEIQNRMLKMIREYASKTVSSEYKKTNNNPIPAILDDETSYFIYTSILNKKFIDEFSYLENTLYNDIYSQILNNLNQEFNKAVINSFNYISTYSNNAIQNHIITEKNKKLIYERTDNNE